MGEIRTVTGATTAHARVKIGVVVSLDETKVLLDRLRTELESSDPGIEFEVMDYPNELNKAFEITDPYKDLEPCKSMDFDDRYTGKCKKLRREARGW